MKHLIVFEQYDSSLQKYRVGSKEGPDVSMIYFDIYDKNEIEEFYQEFDKILQFFVTKQLKDFQCINKLLDYNQQVVQFIKSEEKIQFTLNRKSGEIECIMLSDRIPINYECIKFTIPNNVNFSDLFEIVEIFCKKTADFDNLYKYAKANIPIENQIPEDSNITTTQSKPGLFIAKEDYAKNDKDSVWYFSQLANYNDID